MLDVYILSPLSGPEPRCLEKRRRAANRVVKIEKNSGDVYQPCAGRAGGLPPLGALPPLLFAAYSSHAATLPEFYAANASPLFALLRLPNARRTALCSGGRRFALYARFAA